MVKITRADPALMDAPKRAAARKRAVSPRALEREKQYRQFGRLIRKLDGPEAVFRVKLGRDEKAVTIRQRLLKVAGDEGKEIAVRKHTGGFLVGLMTPERRTRRGRKPKAA
ncbi:MAG TPA: hypothetical protein VFK38_06430 [Candidatus Limnocylindrales bacterium]|nr:hypothetical protein [Candidatus Limnocylindrales bacterium]